MIVRLGSGYGTFFWFLVGSFDCPGVCDWPKYLNHSIELLLLYFSAITRDFAVLSSSHLPLPVGHGYPYCRIYLSRTAISTSLRTHQKRKVSLYHVLWNFSFTRLFLCRLLHLVFVEYRLALISCSLYLHSLLRHVRNFGGNKRKAKTMRCNGVLGTKKTKVLQYSI